MGLRFVHPLMEVWNIVGLLDCLCCCVCENLGKMVMVV